MERIILEVARNICLLVAELARKELERTINKY